MRRGKGNQSQQEKHYENLALGSRKDRRSLHCTENHRQYGVQHQRKATAAVEAEAVAAILRAAEEALSTTPTPADEAEGSDGAEEVVI
jgi:hypothetical protein